MLDLTWIIFGATLCVAGTIGCVVPIVPGSIITYLGILALIPTKYAPSITTCVSFAIVAVIALVSDNIVPMLGAKRFRCSKWGVAGCFLGTLVGLFLGVGGIVVGPFIGAFLGELLSGNGFVGSARGGLGAFVGFVVGMIFKLIASLSMCAWFLHALQGGK